MGGTKKERKGKNRTGKEENKPRRIFFLKTGSYPTYFL